MWVTGNIASNMSLEKKKRKEPDQKSNLLSLYLPNRKHSLYVWCDVLFCPFLSECEEVVEALRRVLWEILHLEQTDGFWAGGAVHQCDSLKDLQSHRETRTWQLITQIQGHAG